MIKKTLAHFVAVALCAIAVSTSSVSAQSLGADFTFRGGSSQPEVQTFGAPQKGTQRFAPVCLSSRDIRRGLRDYGFDDIVLVRELGRNRVIVEALYEDDWYYSMLVHRCKGYVDRVRPLYPADDDY